MQKRYPALEPYLREEQTAHLLERLEAGGLDVAILALPYDLGEVEAEVFMDDPFWLACPPGHPLTANKEIDPAEVPIESLLLLEDGHCLRDHALAACRLQGGRQQESFRGTSLNTLVQMVASGLGVTLLPQMALTSGAFSGVELEVRPLSPEAPARQIGLVWRRTSARKEEFRMLARAVAEIVAGPSP